MHSLESDDKEELKRAIFCGMINSALNTADGSKFSSWKDLVESVAQELHGAAAQSGSPPASAYQEAELIALRKAQMDSFPEDYQLLKSSKPVHSSSRLLCLSPEFDQASNLIRVGGRLRRIEGPIQAQYTLLYWIPITPIPVYSSKIMILAFAIQDRNKCLRSYAEGCGS